MAVALTEEMKGLFRKVRSELGAPVRAVELTDDILCDLFANCVDDYSERVQNWLTEVQWASLYGKNVTNLDMTYALSLRTLDMAKDWLNGQGVSFAWTDVKFGGVFFVIILLLAAVKNWTEQDGKPEDKRESESEAKKE